MAVATSLACAIDDDFTHDVEAGGEHQTDRSQCPALPDGVEPIAGLAVEHAYSRFGGLVITLSSSELACGEPAVQHGDLPPGSGVGLTVGLPAELAVVGEHSLGEPVYVEYRTPTTTNVGGTGDLRSAHVELFEITESCVTGRLVGLVEHGGPFDGGFRAPRCTP